MVVLVSLGTPRRTKLGESLLIHTIMHVGQVEVSRLEVIRRGRVGRPASVASLPVRLGA